MSIDHPASWYAATAALPDPAPPLCDDLEVDVCVVGAGYTGLSTAIELAERGCSVVLLEARRVGWGASGRNGGQLIGGLCDLGRIAPHLDAAGIEAFWQMGVECVDIVRERIHRHDIDCELRPGHIEVALRPRQLRALAAHLAAQQARGYPHRLELLDREALTTQLHASRYLGGLLDHGAGHLHPLKLALGEARVAQALGVQLFEGSAVTAMEPGQRPRVRTAWGSVLARQVVLAGNAYLGELSPHLGRRVLPAGSYIVATEPLGERARELIPGNAAVSDLNVVLDYYRLTPDGRLLFGGLCNYSGREPRDIAASLRPKLERVFPALAGVRIDYQWGGDIGISLNRIPQLGRMPGNILYAQAYSGHGLAPSHLAGRVLAEAICGDGRRLTLFERIRHRALPGGRRFAGPAMALGMLYYRMKDLF